MKRMKLYLHQQVFGFVVVLSIGMLLGGCASSSKEKKAPQPADVTTEQKDSLKEQTPEDAVPEQKGSLTRTHTLVDEQGRKSGTLTVDPVSGTTLRDENGNIVGEFKAVTTPEPQPAETLQERQPVEASSSAPPDDAPLESETGDAPPAPEPSDQPPATEAQD